MAEGEPPAYVGDEKQPQGGEDGSASGSGARGGNGLLIAEIPIGGHTLELRVNYFAIGTFVFLLSALYFGSLSTSQNSYGWMVEGSFLLGKNAKFDKWAQLDVAYSLDRRSESKLYSDCEKSGCTEKDLEDKDRANHDETECKEIKDFGCDDCDKLADWCYATLSAMDAGKIFYIVGVIITVFAMIFLIITTGLPDSLGLPNVLRLLGRVCIVLPAVVFALGFFLFIFIWPFARIDYAQENLQDRIDDGIYEPDSRVYVAGGGGMILGIFTWICACGGCCLGSYGYHADRM